MSNYADKFNINGTEILLKDSEARSALQTKANNSDVAVISSQVTAISASVTSLNNDKADKTALTTTNGNVSANTDAIGQLQTNLTATNAVVAQNGASIASLSSRMDTFTNLPEGSTTGDAELADIRVGALGESYSTAGSAVRFQVEDLLDKTNIIAEQALQTQAITYTNTQGDYYVTATGKTSDTSARIMYFPVTAGDVIKLDLTNAQNATAIFFFSDQDYVPLSDNDHIIGGVYNGSTFEGYVSVPEGATFLVANSPKAWDSANTTIYKCTSFSGMKYWGTITPGAYTNAKPGVSACASSSTTGLPEDMSAYGWIICLVPNNLYYLVSSEASRRIWMKESGSDWILIYPSVPVSRLTGKKIAYNGDSISESRMTGYSANGGGYPYLIAQAVGGTYDNDSVGGGTIAVYGSSYNICENVAGMPDDADIVCFEGGINDYWNNVPLGVFSETDFSGSVNTSTICGALESIFRQALSKWVGKPIVFVIPHKILGTAWTENGAGYTFEDVVEKMIAICNKYSIPFVDMWHDGGLNAYVSALNNAYLNGGATTHPDGCHPDENGYKKYYVPRLIQKFEELLQY